MSIRKTVPGVLVVLVLTAVVAAGRGGADQAARVVQPPKGELGDLLFSIRILESAMTGPVKREFGFFFYAGQSINGYQLRDGKVIDSFSGGGLSDEEFLTQIEAVHFEAFDFNAELKRVEDAHGPQAVVTDGAKFEIRFVHKDIDFQLVAWNPMPKLGRAARFSPAIAKLKALLDVVALHYGRVKVFPGV